MKDIVGQRFGKLIVIKRVENDKFNRSKWLCKCDCGNYKIIAGTFLRTHKTNSCGCLFKEVHSKSKFKNKKQKEFNRIYSILNGMKNRCYNIKSKDYNNYGNRGIKICNEWLDKENGVDNFYNWAINNGYKNNLTIDRIDVNGNYEPNNCRWITCKKQCNNQRTNRIIEYKGKRKTLSEWSEELNIKYSTLNNRVNTNHWTIERAFTQKVRKFNDFK